MPKESIEIPRFDGMVGAADDRDLPPGLAVYARNLNMVTEIGAFIPLKEDAVRTPASSDIVSTKFVKFSSSTGAEFAAYHKTTDNSVRYASNLDSDTPTASASLASRTPVGGSVSGASDGDAVHMGFGPSSLATAKPVWMGYIGHEMFGISDPDATYPSLSIGVHAVDAELKTSALNTRQASPYNDHKAYLPDDTAGANPRKYDNGQVIFERGRRYGYWVSAVYDGFQEAPPIFVGSLSVQYGQLKWVDSDGTVGNPDQINGTLGGVGVGDRAYSDSHWKLASEESSVTESPATGLKQFDFRIWVRTVSGVGDVEVSRRITGLRVYREESDGSRKGLLFFLKHISINDAAWSRGTGTDNRGEQVFSGADITEGYYWMYLFQDNFLATEQDFESRTGFADTVEHMQIHYGLSAAVDGHHYIARCWHRDLKDIYSWLFRSKQYRFDTFDWTQDFLVLPTAPRALASFSSRLYAFSEGITYVINPNTFDIEDEINGIGCEDDRSIVVTDAGMFWCDKNNIYHHDGSRLNVIGTPILRNQFKAAVGFSSRDAAAAPVAAYHPEYNAVIMVFESSSTVYAYMYHIDTKRWVLLDFSGSIDSVNGVLNRTKGTPMLSVTRSSPVDSVLYELFESATDRTWEWVGYQQKTIGGKAVYHHAYVSYKGSAPALTYYADDITYASGAGSGTAWTNTSTPNSGVMKGQVNAKTGGTWDYVRSFALRLSGAAGTAATHISLIARQITAR